MGIKEAETQVKELEAKKAELRARIETQMDVERRTNAEVGAAVANGSGATAKLRKQRQDTRDELEDLTNALPVVESRIAEAQEALRRERVREAQMAVRAVESKAEAWGQALQKSLAPVVARMAEVPAMQADFDRTRSVVHRLTNVTDGGRLNERVTAHSGFSEGFLRQLKDVCSQFDP